MDKKIPGKEISLKELFIKAQSWFSYILSKWIIILLFGAIGGLAGLGYSFVQKPVYTASLTFALEDQQQGGGLSSAIGLASQFGFDIGGSGGGIFAGANLIELFKSRSMVEQTLLKPVAAQGSEISFAEMYIQLAKWREKWSTDQKLASIQFLPNSDRKQFSRAQDSILGVIYQMISLNNLAVGQKDKKLDIIIIVMKSENENFAKYFTEALAKEVSDFYILTKSKKSRINMEILERQTDSIRRELNGAITGVAIANDNTFGLNPALNVRRAPSARRQVDVQANTAILTELVKQTELAKVSVRKETPLIQIIDRPILPLPKERLGKLKAIIIGGLLLGLSAVLFIVGRRAIKEIMNSEV